MGQVGKQKYFESNALSQNIIIMNQIVKIFIMNELILFHLKIQVMSKPSCLLKWVWATNMLQ